MWLITDFETQTKKWFGSLASPHHPENYIVAAGWCTDNGEIMHQYFNNAEEAKNSDWFEKALEGNKILVAHNATFEIHWILKTYPKQFLKWLKDGGRVFCTQYAEYLLSNQTELYPRLEDTAIKYGGTHKLDEVKELWAAGVETSDIDKSTLLDYLASPVYGDIANTRRAVFAQARLLKERGMLQMFWMRMDALLFNAFCTFNGLYVDRDIAAKQQAESEQEMEQLRDEIRKQMPALPSDFEFSFTSGYHLSALLFGGTIEYDTKVSYDPPKYEQVDAYEFSDPLDGHKEYHPITEVDSLVPNAMDTVTRYSRGKNAGQPKVFKIDSTIEKLKNGTAQVKFDGLIKLDELPNHVKDLFIGDKAEYKGARALPDGTPVYSTKDEVLDLVAKFSAACKPISKLRALQKDVGTYYMTDDGKGGKKGMLQFVEPNGIIHHQLNNCATVTTRLSSSNPNLQNLPTDGTSKVKRMFVSRFGADGRITEVDYSALEVVMGATISGDTNLLKQLQAGTDMHCYRLAGALGEDYESVLLKCKDESHPDHTKYKHMRRDIKPKAFSKQYGASARGISYNTGCTVEEAEEFIRVEEELFPQFSTFAQRVVRPEVERTGLEAKPERELNNGAWCLYRRGYFQAKGGTCYSYRQYPTWIRGIGNTYDYKDTQISNYWCQGEGSLVVQVASGRVIRHLIANDFYNGQVLPINTVHDAIYTDSANQAVAEESARAIQNIMETTPKYMAEIIPAYKDWGYHVTPFPAVPEVGKNMMEKEHV